MTGEENTPYPGVAFLMAMPQYGLGGSVAIRPGLDRIRQLLGAMGHPESGLRVIHVAGTNGKGSTASFAAAILTEHGLRCGLHTSPHLRRVGERMRVDGAPAPEAWVNEAVLAIRDGVVEIGASYFETTVALSLLYFAEQSVDLAVVEVGLGGRLDATNVLDTDVSVITRIARDHTGILGDSLREIAAEKAGIMRAGVPVVLGRQDPEVLDVLEGAAQSLGCPLSRIDEAAWFGDELVVGGLRIPALRLPLPGLHQRDNAVAAALASAAFLQGSLEPGAVHRGLTGVRTVAGLRARYEMWKEDPLIVLDVAHNPDALLPLLDRFGSDAAGKPAHVALSIMADKELEAVAQRLAMLDMKVIPVPLTSPRALPAVDLRGLLDAHGVRTMAPRRCQDLGPLLKGGSGGALLVTGSHQLVGGFLDAFEPDLG